jgi:nicotinamide riboside kinase
MLKQTIYFKTRDKLAYYMDLMRVAYYHDDMRTLAKIEIIKDYYERCKGVLEFVWLNLSVIDGDQYENLYDRVRKFMWHYCKKLYESEVK